jgi:hypothetical protein
MRPMLGGNVGCFGATKPVRIINQVPIMHSPGEITQVANLYDSRIFDEPNLVSEPNIEFHIHAFLNPTNNRAGPVAAQNGQNVRANVAGPARM